MTSGHHICSPIGSHLKWLSRSDWMPRSHVLIGWLHLDYVMMTTFIIFHQWGLILSLSTVTPGYLSFLRVTFSKVIKFHQIKTKHRAWWGSNGAGQRYPNERPFQGSSINFKFYICGFKVYSKLQNLQKIKIFEKWKKVQKIENCRPPDIRHPGVA